MLELRSFNCKVYTLFCNLLVFSYTNINLFTDVNNNKFYLYLSRSFRDKTDKQSDVPFYIVR
jgi:hypothetical protein